VARNFGSLVRRLLRVFGGHFRILCQQLSGKEWKVTERPGRLCWRILLSFFVGPLMASPMIHNWTLLFLLFVEAVYFDKKFEILWSCSSVIWVFLTYLRLRPFMFIDGETWRIK
jgi:hypothetical protein